MTLPLPELPVSAVLPELRAALREPGTAVLAAPPGAGKTTLVPLALLDEPWADGRIVLLEPRRLAARAAAGRMAELLGEEVGATVGYAMRMESRVSARTRVLVVTEGVLARMILDDPELSGVAAVIFDEFHERSLDGDFGLALALDIRGALRPDLRLAVMSATLDGARVAKLVQGATVIESQGRSFPVEIRHRERPAGMAVEDAMAAAIREALVAEPGSILAFLPGQKEILRTAEMLEGRVGAEVDIVPLYGQLDQRSQDAAIRPPPPGRRKVVLATSIAETSITIDGVRVVVDSGLSRLPRFDPGTGLTRLETVRASQASAAQRAGRAGRTQPGVAIRLWREEQTGAMPPFTPPEILAADLSGLLLDCAAFGVADPGRLALLDPPPAAALAEARALLVSLGALDGDGRLTADGAALRRLPLQVRLAHMVVRAAREGAAEAAAQLAVLITERGLGGSGVDLDERLRRFRADRGHRAENARRLAGRLAAETGKPAGGTPAVPETGAGPLLLHAWPERVAKARGARGQFLLANGSGAALDASEPLAGEAFLVAAEIQGRAQNARIVSAAAVSEDAIRDRLEDRLQRRTATEFDLERRALRRRETLRLGALVFAERILPVPAGADADCGLLDALRAHGLGLLDWDNAAGELRRRLAWLRRGLGEPWPDMADEALLARLDEWLLPFLSGQGSLARIGPDVLTAGLLSLVPHDLQRRIGELAPTHFEAPSGSRVPIRYDGEHPVLAIRVQELFGLATHPAIAAGTVPLTLELLSPAHRPIQTTADLPGFWRGSWAEVRAAMRGRYPKHPWPEDPLQARPTSRAKPRA